LHFWKAKKITVFTILSVGQRRYGFVFMMDTPRDQYCPNFQRRFFHIFLYPFSSNHHTLRRTFASQLGMYIIG
jgi:hypothetical protein